MFLIPILFVSWLTIAFVAYRIILREETTTAQDGTRTTGDEAERNSVEVQSLFNPYVRIF